MKKIWIIVPKPGNNYLVRNKEDKKETVISVKTTQCKIEAFINLKEAGFDKEQREEIFQEIYEKVGKTESFEGLINFDELRKFFVKTHSHLEIYELVDSELGLKGHEYYAAKKFLCYLMESCKQRTVNFIVGKEWFDNRLHGLFIVPASRGKGQIKNMLNCVEDEAEITGGTHVEQLIGKMVKQGKEVIEKRGYFSKELLKIDEAQDLIRQEDKHYSELMREYRLAADVYRRNKVEKKLVDTDYLTYFPPTRFVFFSHPIILPAIFFDTGTFRRFFTFVLKPNKILEKDAYSNLLEEPQTSELREYMANRSQDYSLSITKEAIDEVIEWISAWNKFLLKNSNQRLRAIGERMIFTTKLYFFRIVGILAKIKGERFISKKTALTACFDCTQFLIETIEYYSNNSKITLSRDIWKTDDLQEAMFLEWLYYKEAKNEEETKVSVFDAREELQDIFGINERQGKAKMKKLKKDGLIGSTQVGQYGSKIWLCFEPEMGGIVEFEEGNDISFEEFLYDKKEELFGGVRSVGTEGVSKQYSNITWCVDYSLFSSFFNNIIEEGVSNDTPNTPNTNSLKTNESSQNLGVSGVQTPSKSKCTPEDNKDKLCDVCRVSSLDIPLSWYNGRWLCSACSANEKRYNL